MTAPPISKLLRRIFGGSIVDVGVAVGDGLGVFVTVEVGVGVTLGEEVGVSVGVGD